MRKIGEYDEEHIRSQTPLKLWFKLLGALAVVCVTIGIFAFSCGWIRTGAEVVGPDNVKKQWQFAYDYSESLRGIAGNWCTAKRTENETTDPTAHDQRVSQRIAVENNYRRVQNEYDARLDDAFRARLVRPPDVPVDAPTLEQQLVAVRCEVAPSGAAPAPSPTG